MQETAYEKRISDWSSDGCASDLEAALADPGYPYGSVPGRERRDPARLDVRGDAQPGSRRAERRGPGESGYRAFTQRVRHVLSHGRLSRPSDEDLRRRQDRKSTRLNPSH